MADVHYQFFMLSTPHDGAYERLRRWTARAGVRLEREEYVYALVWSTSGIVRLIEVSFAPNGIAARTGIVATNSPYGVRLEPDKRAMTSWHCAPYHRLEELLSELHTAAPGSAPGRQ